MPRDVHLPWIAPRAWPRATGVSLALLGVLSTAAPALAQDSGVATPVQVPRIAATPLGEAQAPQIDGRLDDPAWELAEPLTDFRQVIPIAGAEPSERTVVRLLVGPEALYIGVDCLDSDPTGIRATQMERDANLDPDDRVEIVLDTFSDGQNAFWFQVGPVGGMGDALISRGGNAFNKDWDGIWLARSRVTETGWQAEFRLPWATLAFNPDKDVWGFNLRRFIRRRTEEVRWASPDPGSRFFAPVFAGELSGLGGQNQGLGLDLKPFAVGRYLRDDESGDRDRTGDIGLDLFWRISNSTKLSLSVNTDFAEAEVDSRQVNLSRFSLFFPERRDFFLEDSSAFEFGPGSSGGRDVLPFFSRAIGLDENRAPVPLLGAAKLTARTEDYSVGLLNVQQDSTDTLDSRNIFVGRFSKSIGDQSDAGVIFTQGDPAADTTASTWGADLNLRTNTLFGDRNGRLSALFVESRGLDGAADGEALSLIASYPNDEVDLTASYLEVDDGFDPRLGFVRRTGIRRYSADLEWRPRLNTAIRRLVFSVDPDRITNLDNDVESESLRIVPLGIDWESDDRLRVFASAQREVLDDPFEIADSVTIQTGDFDFLRYGASFQTSDRRPVSTRVRFEDGEFYDGNRFDLGLDLDWRPNATLGLGLEYDYQNVELTAGDFEVNIASADIDVLFSPDLSWNSIIQYDNLSDDLGLQSRVRWIVQPGNEIFFVVNQSWLAESGSYVPGDGSLVAKVGWTLRF